MAKLIIDHREIEVPEGTKVIEAAERLGIMIPRFCYHPALGSLGACRMCAVKFLEGPVKGVEMSCMIEAEDGMVVSTTDDEAVDFRRSVIEWLMLNHPHDCPVCDEGGHCLLQDETVSGGHGRRRYLGLKRTYLDQYLGEFVQHEMNRCIHCWRCRRFYQEFAGYRDFGAMQIGSHIYFGRFNDGPLESPFAGNLIDLCPTGVLTDKPARYKGRRWDFERAPSLCLHCSLGCNTVGSARYREVVRQEGRFHERGERLFHLRPGAIRLRLYQPPRPPQKGTPGNQGSICGRGSAGGRQPARPNQPGPRRRGRGRMGFPPEQPGNPGFSAEALPAAGVARTAIFPQSLSGAQSQSGAYPGWIPASPSPCGIWKNRISSWWPGWTRCRKPRCSPWPCGRHIAGEGRWR